MALCEATVVCLLDLPDNGVHAYGRDLRGRVMWTARYTEDKPRETVVHSHVTPEGGLDTKLEFVPKASSNQEAPQTCVLPSSTRHELCVRTRRSQSLAYEQLHTQWVKHMLSDMAKDSSLTVTDWRRREVECPISLRALHRAVVRFRNGKPFGCKIGRPTLLPRELETGLAELLRKQQELGRINSLEMMRLVVQHYVARPMEGELDDMAGVARLRLINSDAWLRQFCERHALLLHGVAAHAVKSET